MEVKLLHHACNFSSEVVSTLLQAFALLEAGELDDLDVAAQILSDLSGVLSNRQVAVLDELLIDQAVLLEELLDLALDHLLLHSLGLVSGLGIASHLSQHDLFLLSHDLGGDRSLVDVAGVSSSDLHSDVLAVSNELVLSVDVVGGLEVDQNAVGAAAVDVCRADGYPVPCPVPAAVQ